MDRITFYLNGTKHSVGPETPSTTMLLDYIRQTASLKGTKFMCREGSCGCCIVSAVKTPGGDTTAVNSCLVPILSCQDWKITTIEKVGNKLQGYHPIQTALFEHHGTQCGYCTPGWVMALYSLLQSKKNLTPLEIEKSFGSNICRCTGYRPILDAFKTFANETTEPIQVPDLEDLKICDKTNCKKCPKKDLCENDWHFVEDNEISQPNSIKIDLIDNKKWYRVYSIKEVFDVFATEDIRLCKLVAGNTAKGKKYPTNNINPKVLMFGRVYPTKDESNVLIDITGIAELKSYEFDQNLVLGAGNTISEVVEIFKNAAKQESFQYLQKFIQHLELVAHIPVKNVGTVAGNLMIKKKHNEFPSDLFLLLETVGAMLTIIVNRKGATLTISLRDFLSIQMSGKIILNILLPPLSALHKVVSFKIMPKCQNAPAIVNAGFLYKFKADGETISSSRIVFGGLSANFARAKSTEAYLTNKRIFENNVLQKALSILQNEIVLDENPLSSKTYRKQLALGLFFKGLLAICPIERIDARNRSGSKRLRESRPVSENQQNYDTYQSIWPLTKPVRKVDGLIQTSGETQYIGDLLAFPYEVNLALVLSTVAKGTIVSIDATEALSQPGVKAIFSAKDIPGKNTFMSTFSKNVLADEEIFCSKNVMYFNQPIGVIVATTTEQAQNAANLVKVTYDSIDKPVIDVKLAKLIPSRVTLAGEVLASDKGNDVFKTLKGVTKVYAQIHAQMELVGCVTRTTEEGIEVYPTSQWINLIQTCTSQALNLDQNKIDVVLRRIGGGFGLKASRPAQIAVIANLVSYKLNRPCRIVIPFTTACNIFGKRCPSITEYEVVINDHGVIQQVKVDLYGDHGYIVSEPVVQVTITTYFNCYDKSKWHFRCFNVLTDTPSNTWCRGPGTLETIANAETILERISYELSLDPIDVRLANFDSSMSLLKEMTMTLRNSAQYDERKSTVLKFNRENRWIKRGLRFSSMSWRCKQPQYFEVNLAPYADGSVIITHGGVEMGQGINTKAIQICAYFLKIPMEKIQIKANNTIVAPNCSVTAQSLTSHSIGVGVQRCCEELLKRLEPVKTQMDDPTWEELIKKALYDDVDLQVHGFVNGDDVPDYNVYGVALAEVEVDMLTGEWLILRVDIIQDAGLSLSPEIDVGQVEGAFIMGLGYWTTENIVYDDKTGRILTDRLWNYYLPQARDTPLDFRVSLTKNSFSTKSILGTKAVGEPGICLSVVITFALREAINAARIETGHSFDELFQIEGGFTQDKILQLAKTDIAHFTYDWK